jgi:hypothetical protein
MTKVAGPAASGLSQYWIMAFTRIPARGRLPVGWIVGGFWPANQKWPR